MANYHQVKNAAILTPTGSTDLGSDSNRYSNVFMSGNIMMSNGVTVTSTNVITPKIASVTYPGNDTAADIAGGQTITITGTGFSAGASVLLGTTPSTVVTVVSSTSITFTSPALTAGNYALYVINSDGGTAIYIPGIAFSGTPVWSTSSGNIASVYETNSISSTVAATGDATISYSVNSGTLPTGSTLNTSTGLISGTAPASAGSTTYSFSIRATDGQNQDTDRSFTITVNTDSVSWSSPADNTSTALEQGAVMSNFTMSATSAAGKSITYTANSLPTGLSISGANVTGTPTVVGSTTSLITATAANSGRTATRTFNWVVSVASDTYWKYTTLLINGEGAAASNNAVNNTYIDSSTNAYTVTTSGSPVQGTFSPYSASSWSNYFDGSGDYLTPPMLNFGTSDFTVEAWVYPTGPIGGDGGVNSQMLYISTGASTRLAFRLNSLNKMDLYLNAATPGVTTYTSNTVCSLNTWYHLAAVRTGGVIQLYVNGVLDNTPSASIHDINGNDVYSYIGSIGASTQPFTGYISNFRITNTAVYTATFTPSTTPLTAISGTRLLTCQSNRIIDNSTNAYSITRNGDTSVQKFSPFNGTNAYDPATYGGSMYLDGSSHLVVSSGNLLNVSASDNWTIECWVYWNSIPGGYVHLFIGSGISFGLYAGTYYVTNNAQGLINGGSAVTGQWTHVALVNIASTSYKIYINGVQVATGGATGFTATATYIGRAWDNTGGVTGYMSDIRIVRGTAVYTGSFTPPTSPLTAIANTALLISGTNAGVIDQTGNHNIITVGDGSAKISTSVKKFGTGSLSFGGTGGWIEPKQIGPNLIKLGTGDWTFEFWLRVPNITQSGIWLVNWNTDPRLQLTNATLSWMTAGAARITTGNVLTANTWQHIAVVKYSGNTKIYVDGTQSGSTYADSNSYTATAMDAIGYHPFVGYIDDFRISRGYARYTANFTPPTQAFITK